MKSRLFCYACFVFGVSTNAWAQAAQRLTADSVTPAVWGVLEKPALGSTTSVILVPGTTGLIPGYAQLAKMLADSGFTALALDYYKDTGRDSSSADAVRLRPSWAKVLSNAITYLHSRNPVQSIALIGFSRGVPLILDIANSTSGVSSIVSFYGAGPADSVKLAMQMNRLPPLLILAGDSDELVPVAQAYRLRDAVRTSGGDAELRIFSGAKHGFSVPGRPTYSETAATAAWSDVIKFLRAQSQRRPS